jgi:lipid II:glycine glycyltransferase (peptidoglycan interpeptide bridge formation enzyme)
LKGSFGWEPSRLAISQDGCLLAAAQMLMRRLPYRSLAYVPRGPVCDPSQEEIYGTLLSALHQAARRRGAIALKVEPTWLDSPEAAARWRAYGFQPGPQTVQPRRTSIVDLRPGEETILARMKPKWRYNVRLAARKEVTIRQGGAEDLPVFYALMRETGERDGFAVHTAGYYKTAFHLFHLRDQVALLLADYHGEPLATLMVFAFGPLAVYMYGASGNRERARMPNHLLQWEAMRWARGRGCTGYDLWGIADADPASPSAVLSGVERFKLGFGGETVRYAGAFDYAYSPLAHRAFNWLWSWRRSRARRSATGTIDA